MENGCNPNPNPSGDLEVAKEKRGGAYNIKYEIRLLKRGSAGASRPAI